MHQAHDLLALRTWICIELVHVATEVNLCSQGSIAEGLVWMQLRLSLGESEGRRSANIMARALRGRRGRRGLHANPLLCLAHLAKTLGHIQNATEVVRDGIQQPQRLASLSSSVQLQHP